ncbi:HlyD family efflux transporter periplasmic adaptor subunit [Aliiglaciecola sp. 3_MG-2023]|uniref:HlyD family secretion protein n=1 Tax=Aliiglaciecola sp. 3_MG-2023 TaxID=3062644 RepID=UPI0026E478D7|nr:HlyD family efflux transporter periplasmic adaptor subunit [Aliiglaciecola sp. 3_MG-2023]MDO6695730.1 HlyD family efflux transporter periplasmic adaptor subunit [Aliiglaciecola sp. 3_MG-2023]
MQESLFRQSAIDHQKNRLHGEILLIPSASHVFVSLFLSAWIVAAFAWLVSSQYARKESVGGWLEPPSGVVKVFPETSSGRIEQVLITEGQIVSEGQALAVIEGDRTLSSGSSLQTTLLAEYKNQQQLLMAQLKRAEIVNDINIENTQSKLVSMGQDIIRLDAQIQTLQKRYSLVASRYQNYQSMGQSGHISKADLEQVLEQKLALQNQQQGLQREKINLNNEITTTENQLLTLPQNQLNQTNQLKSKLSDLALKIAQLNGQSRHVLKASRDGIVSNLLAQIGQQTNQNTPLLSIVPQKSQIEAKLLVPVKAIGFVQQGQPIQIRYDAFPYQKFGLYLGKITSVSDAVILPNEVHNAPVSIQEPVYLVHATLDSQFVSAYGKQLNLKSGMTLSADVQLGERSLLEWIFEPLLSLRGRI